MKKNIFLLSVAVFTLFISACGVDDEDGIFAGSECTFEGAEICSDNGIDILVCQSSTWTLKKQCNISIGKKCRPGSDGALGCFGDGESVTPGNQDYDGSEDPDFSDTDQVPDSGEKDPEPADAGIEETDDDNTSENPSGTDDHDSGSQPDSDHDTPDNSVTPDNDSDADTDTDNQTPPAGQCSSNSDCSGATPYCSISTSECIANAVFITEYVEGSGNNKAVEIYNGSKSSVNLSNFTIRQANNGKDWGSGTNFVYSFTDSTSIPSGKTFVFCNVASDTELVAKCDQTPTSSVFQFNGDDGIALFDGSSIVDQIGISGDVEAWDAAGVAGATKDHTLRRKTSVIQGTSFWSDSAGTTAENSQWIVLDQDTFDGLGIR